jgi:HD-GYP domain-containing protein (c-di-GMP phosphodiesterase class II)
MVAEVPHAAVERYRVKTSTATDTGRPGGYRQGRGGTPALEGIPAVSVEELLCAFSLALDLAEGRPKGHALRVCFIASSLAAELDLPRSQRTAAYFVGLLHDIGVPHASESVSAMPRSYEQELFASSPLHTREALVTRFGRERLEEITDALHEHAFEGATAAAGLGMPPQVAEAVLCHHERHDGSGFPLGLSGNDVPVVARVVAMADYAEALLTAEVNPLLARRRLDAALREQSGRAFHPKVVEAMVTLARRDTFWLSFHNESLFALLGEMSGQEVRPMAEETVLRTAGAFAEIADTKNSFKRGHSRRVGCFVRALTGALGLPEGHARAIELAGLIHDIGMLRVPSRIIGKPEILSVEEMGMLHEHPLESAEIVRAIPAWATIAGWVAAHHERLDGRGYPDGLIGDEIPFESRILAIADIYEALTAERPHRRAMAPGDAVNVLRGMIGANVDPVLFAAFEQIGPGTAETVREP